MKINSKVMYHEQKNISFKAGKTILITDFDFTFSPKAFEDKYLPKDVKRYEDIANPYFKKFSDLQKKMKDFFKIFISSGRKQGKGFTEADFIFQRFSLLKKENQPKIEAVIENNGRAFFKTSETDGKIVLIEDVEKNKIRDKFRKELKDKNRGQEITKDLDAFIAIKKAQKEDDLIIVSGDGTNDRSFLNIYSYIDIPEDEKIPKSKIESENLLAKYPKLKQKIDNLPLKVIIMEGDCAKEEYYQYLIKTFPNNYKTGQQAFKIGENPLFDNIEKSIEEYKLSNKKYADALKKK